MYDDSMPAVTSHAIDKYQSITGCRDRKLALQKIVSLLARARQVQLDPVISALRALNSAANGEYPLTIADYFEFDQLRFVVVDSVIVTVEKKFKRDRRRKYVGPACRSLNRRR